MTPAPMPCVVCGKPTNGRMSARQVVDDLPWWFRALYAVAAWALWPSRPVCVDGTQCPATLGVELAKQQGLVK